MHHHVVMKKTKKQLTTMKLRNHLAILVLGGFMMAALPTMSQTEQWVEQQKEVIKMRKTMAKMTRKQVESNVWKETKRQVRAWKKEGWKSSPGTPSLEQQLNDALMAQYELEGTFPRFIIGRGSGYGSTFGTARKQAVARARADVAACIQTEVTELIEASESNVELSHSDVETVGKVLTSSRQFVEQSLGRTQVVFEAFREKDGKTEVMVNVSCDGRSARSTVLKAFEKESGELQEKLSKLMGE